MRIERRRPLDVRRLPSHRFLRRGRGLATVLVVIVVAAVVAVVAARAAAPDRPARGPLPITVSGDTIQRAGQNWWLVGYNSFTWSGNCGDPGERMTADQTDSWIRSMRHDGHGVVRLFFFPGWDIGRLDRVIETARRNDVYVAITVDNGINGCGQAAKDASWFDDPARRDAYARHLTDLVGRYRGDPTIAWFEYLNEPGYAEGRLRAFYDEMGARARSVDPSRLFASGTIAPYALGGADAFRDVSSSPGVDIASLHEYDFNEAESNHGPSTRANSDGKPVVVGEFGAVPFAAEKTCRTGDDQVATIVQRKVDAYLGTTGYAGAIAWAWQPNRDRPSCFPALDSDPETQSVMREVNR